MFQLILFLILNEKDKDRHFSHHVRSLFFKFRIIIKLYRSTTSRIIKIFKQKELQTQKTIEKIATQILRLLKFIIQNLKNI